MQLRLTHALSLSLLTFGITTNFAAGAKPKADRTENRGPESVELKFKLPPPPPLTPEETLKTFKLAKGFKIQLVAAEPLIQSPVSMSWDDQGRLYVCEMIGYMHDVDAKGEDQPIGRVSLLEDTDGDGQMDKSTVFVDKLLMPRSVTAFGDGVIVAEPPNLTWYRDTDGDGKVDKTELITNDFGSKGGQPEHMANSLTMGQDNWLSAAGYGQRFRYLKGQFIKEPTRSAGQWGLTQDDWGRRYFNYNSDFLRTDLLSPSVYARNPNLSDRQALNFQVMKDQTTWPSVPTPGVNRGYTEPVRKPDGTFTKGQLREDGTLQTCTATCGPVIYRGDLFPKEFQGNAFIPEPAGYLVKRLILKDKDGIVSGENAYTNTEFLTSTDERFRPVNAYNGPDGALYLVDMARGVIQHKFFLTHYLIANIKARNLEQPVNLGRIWRIVPEDVTAKPVKLPAETAAIVPFLDHSNGHLRDTAQQVIVQRGDVSVVDAVKKLAAEATTPQGRVQALATLEGLQAITPDLLAASFKDSDAKVRAFAVRLANLASAMDLLKMVEDPSAEVRVQLALQLSSQPGPDAQKAVLSLLKKGGSPLINDAIACGIRGRELEYLEALLLEPADKTDKLASSGLLQMLAGCVMTERRESRVARLLELTAAQTTESPRQLALINGMAGTPLLKTVKAQPRKLLYLAKQPESLASLKSRATKGPTKTLLATVDKALAWPGKPGVPPPPVVVPLNAEQQARFEKGKMLYAGVCAACHQPNGAGLEGLAPPLADSEWVTGRVEHPIRIILHGVGGPISVAGRTWNLEMPPLPIFSDEDIASILTYLRREWDHTASPVSPAAVAKVREADKGRTKSWTAEELKKAK